MRPNCNSKCKVVSNCVINVELVETISVSSKSYGIWSERERWRCQLLNLASFLFLYSWLCWWCSIDSSIIYKKHISTKLLYKKKKNELVDTNIRLSHKCNIKSIAQLWQQGQEPAGWVLFVCWWNVHTAPDKAEPTWKKVHGHLNKAIIKCKDSISLWSSKA